jgi:hypothetical protein
MKTTFFFLFFPFIGFSQNTCNTINSITKEDLQNHLSIIASDYMQGRETGELGQKRAAKYIDSVFTSLHLSFAPGLDGFQQEFQCLKSIPKGKITINEHEYLLGREFFYLNVDKPIKIQTQLLFQHTNSLDTLTKLPKNTGVVIEETAPSTIKELFIKAKSISQTNPSVIIFALSNYGQFADFYGQHLGRESMRLYKDEDFYSIPIIFIQNEKVNVLLTSRKEKKWLKNTKKKMSILTKQIIEINLGEKNEVVKSSNLLGVIYGSDSTLKNEVLVVSAHYDHLGIYDGEIYNGADDNGSGTSAILEIAQAFSLAKEQGKGPKRTVLILLVSGEEKGLLGSEYYTENPAFLLEKTITDLNVDMIGRTDEFHENPDYIYIIGSDMLSDDLQKISEEAGKERGNIFLDYKYNTKEDPNRFYYRSDHYNFAKNGIPSIFYFSGVHDDYHQPTDTIEKINFDKMEKIAQLIYLTACKLTNSTNRPTVNKPID